MFLPPCINPNHPKPFKLQQQGLFDFDGLYSPDRYTLHGARCTNYSQVQQLAGVHGVGFWRIQEGS